MFDRTVIDAHVHVGHVREDEPPMTAGRMLEWMDANGIDRAVLLPLESPEASSYYVTTNSALDLAEERSSRFVPFCVMDPRMNLAGGREAFADRIASYVERGARGFGELKVGLPIDDERMRTLYELCDAHDLPVLFHMDALRGTDEIGLPNLERVLREFPGVDFVAHAQGWWAHVSGDVDESVDLSGYPGGPVEPGGRCGELLSGYDNLYADVSAGSGWNALTRDPEHGQSFLERHHEKLLFATDYLYPDQEVPQLGILETFEFTDGMAENVLHRNLEGLLR